jgi:hypothetical protein
VSDRLPSDLKVGDTVPLPKPKLDVRPAFTGAGKPTHRPARKPGRFGA